jgi:hypothetical protein
MSSSPAVIPYEKQSPELTGRACGAACLSMAYRSFGKQVAQTEIWPAIAKANRFGQISSTTYLMTQDALKRGFSAVAVQARHPMQALLLSKEAGIRAILNHRARRDSAAGHYSLLVDIDSKEVVIHDPLFGAARRLSHAELMELWLQPVPNSEIAGGVLIAIGALGLPAQPACEFCRTPMLSRVDCPRCQNPVGLEPGAVLRCIRDGCIARMWNWVCCPLCDHVFTFNAGVADTPVEAQPSAAVAAVPVDAVDLAKLFAEIDKFTSNIRNMPKAVNNPEIQKKLDLLEAGKERIRVAHAEDLARRAAVVGQFAAFEEMTKQQEEEQLKKVEDRNAPAPPLDGDALSDAMFKNLGFK